MFFTLMSLYLIDGTVLRIANHTNKFIFDPLEAPDEEEKEAIVSDLLSFDPIQGKISVSSYTIEPLLSRKKKFVYENVNGTFCICPCMDS